MLGLNLNGRVMIPIYRERGGGDARLIRMRYGLTGAVVCLLAVMAFAGPALVALLYGSATPPAARSSCCSRWPGFRR
ncbi:hypothetical protein ACFSUD_05245 [Sulfitobacter aestuarii]|uniref:Uncharacterized protein n=1 Tax=Sulfitobacter aestuarii TaxID=2161676 RepID=A0ABW5TZ73_9RHOB